MISQSILTSRPILSNSPTKSTQFRQHGLSQGFYDLQAGVHYLLLPGIPASENLWTLLVLSIRGLSGYFLAANKDLNDYRETLA